MAVHLFASDNHSADEPSFVTLDEATKTWLHRRLHEFYPDERDAWTSLQGIGGTNINSGNYRAGRFYVKTIRDPTGSKSYVRSFPALTEALALGGIPVSRFVPNISKEPVSEFYCSDHNSQFFLYVQEYVEGSFFRGTGPELSHALSVLGRMAELTLAPTSEPRNPYIAFVRNVPLEDPGTLLRGRPVENDFDRLAAAAVAEAVRILPSRVSLIHEIAAYRGSLFHVDLHPHNLLSRDDAVVAVLDLESFVQIPRALSEAFGILKLGRKAVSQRRLDVGEVSALADRAGFNLAQLHPWIEVELLRRALSVIRLHYVEGNTLWSADLVKQFSALGEARAIFLTT